MTYLKGIDVSRWQPTTPSLAGLEFAFAKASEALAPDPRWAMHSANIRKAGIILGAYHFARSDISTPEKQAQYFVATAPDADLYALDVEGVHAFSPAEITRFMVQMHALGKTCGLYRSRSGFTLNLGQDWNWVADYRAGSFPTIPWAFWQYTPTPIDQDFFNGDRDALYRLAGKGDDVLDRYVLQHWTANGTDGVLRAKPDRAAPVIARLPAGTDIVSFGEWLDKATGNAWRAAEWPKGSGTIAYFLRYGPGIAKDHDFIAGAFATPGGFTQADLDAATLAARQKQWDLDHQFAVVTLPARPS